MEAAALILAAGRGKRAGGSVPKQYAALPGGCAVAQCIHGLLRHPALGAVRVVIHPSDLARYRDAAAPFEGPRLLPPTNGGSERQDSALRGLVSLTERAPSRVLIHDAARPCVDLPTVDRVLDALNATPAAIPAMPIPDAIWEVEPNGACVRQLDRRRHRRAQTPQGFRFDEILSAHKAQAGAGLADDAEVAIRAGLRVKIVEGSPALRKLTTPEDLRSARRPASPPLRVGQGFDAHRFGPGDGVRLCGVTIPHGRGLVGHSDADVGFHALADAIYGAVGAGDIGQHFPSGDPRWRGKDSTAFLRHAAAEAIAVGFPVAQVDVTLICEQPRIGAHRNLMRQRTAEALGLATAAVSVKATTTERMGFAGRGEGIAALALATLVGTQ